MVGNPPLKSNLEEGKTDPARGSPLEYPEVSVMEPQEV